MFSVVSRRKAALSRAACSGRSGGQRRVLEWPGRGDFAITPMAQLSLKPNAIPSGPHVWPFVEDLTRCPSVRGYKRVQLGLDISGRGVVRPSCKVFFLRTPNKVTGPSLSGATFRRQPDWTCTSQTSVGG